MVKDVQGKFFLHRCLEFAAEDDDGNRYDRGILPVFGETYEYPGNEGIWITWRKKIRLIWPCVQQR